MTGRSHRKYYDPTNRRLVFVGEATSDAFWDARWQRSGEASYPARFSSRNLVVRETRRFLPAGSLVLEGGCGRAVGSWRLHRLGYRAVALDYARQTVFQVGRAVPEVRPIVGDVTALPLAPGSCDGYWSMGVIEHSYGGYASMAAEMRRVLRRGGVLFLAFPSLSPLRSVKARLGLYPVWDEPGSELECFYQFALSGRRVARELAELGFELVRAVPFLGVTGIGEELGRLGEWLEHRTRGGSRLHRMARGALDLLLRPFCHHCLLLVLRKS